MKLLYQVLISINRTVEQPLKIPFIAAIVLLVNVKKPEFTEEVLKKVGTSLQTYIDDGCWREVKLCLRFLGSLQGLFGGEGVFGVLEDLFQRAVDLQTESSEDVRQSSGRPEQKLTRTLVSRP
jgi:nuclear cap-binding protein subunit 1